MEDERAAQGATEVAKLIFVLPIRPGRSEPYRRFLQELKASRRVDFEAACRRWGICCVAIWLAQGRGGDLAVIQLRLAADLAEAEERFALSQLPFDMWIKERVRELHDVDPNSLIRYQAELLEVWQDLDPA
jgi:hypothetical protein